MFFASFTSCYCRVSGNICRVCCWSCCLVFSLSRRCSPLLFLHYFITILLVWLAYACLSVYAFWILCLFYLSRFFSSSFAASFGSGTYFMCTIFSNRFVFHLSIRNFIILRWQHFIGSSGWLKGVQLISLIPWTIRQTASICKWIPSYHTQAFRMYEKIFLECNNEITMNIRREVAMNQWLDQVYDTTNRMTCMVNISCYLSGRSSDLCLTNIVNVNILLLWMRISATGRK